MSTTQDGYVAQHGGTHYQAEVQHWDFVVENGIGYLEGCASKYVTRARKKTGRDDLLKAISYIDKIIAKGRQGFVKPPFYLRWVMAFMSAWKYEVPVAATQPLPVSEFAKANGLTQQETLAVRMICDWRTGADLDLAKRICQQLIDEIDAKAAGANPQL